MEDRGPVQVCLNKNLPTTSAFFVVLNVLELQPNVEAQGKHVWTYELLNVTMQESRMDVLSRIILLFHIIISNLVYLYQCSIQCWCSLHSLAGVDFDDSNVVVRFPQAAGDSCVNISIIDDSIALEGDERFVVTYVNLPQGVNSGPLTQTNITIQNNDGMFIS